MGFEKTSMSMEREEPNVVLLGPQLPNINMDNHVPLIAGEFQIKLFQKFFSELGF